MISFIGGAFVRSFIHRPSIHPFSHLLSVETTLQSRHMPRGVIVSRTTTFNIVISLEASLEVSSSTLIRMVLPEEL